MSMDYNEKLPEKHEIEFLIDRFSKIPDFDTIKKNRGRELIEKIFKGE